MSAPCLVNAKGARRSPILAPGSRLGVAVGRAFGLTWEDCEELLSQLGFSARVSIMTA